MDEENKSAEAPRPAAFVTMVELAQKAYQEGFKKGFEVACFALGVDPRNPPQKKPD